MYRTADQQAREIANDFTIVIVLQLALLVVVALLLWPLGEIRLALTLAKGFGIFYVTLWGVFVLNLLAQKVFRIDDDSHFDAYILLNLAAGAIPLAGWSAFAALTMRAAAADAPVWLAAILWLIGLFTSWMAFGVVSAYYSGSFYRNVHLPLAAIGFLLFAAWPAAARFLFGWFFNFW